MDPFIAAIADFERLPIPGGVLELDGTITAANAAGARLLGRPADQLIGKKAWDFAPGAEHIWDDVIGSARTADYHGDIAIATPKGPLDIHYVIALRVHEGRSVALLFAVEVPKAEAEDHTQRVEALGMVAGGIAHDFNNQLVSVLAEASATREYALPEVAQDSLRRIEAAAQRMALLTRQLLAYAGRGRFVTEVIDPDGLLTEMHDHLQRIVRPDSQLILAAGQTRAAIEADRTLLREVIVNLVVNASEALASGGRIRVSTSQLPRDGSGSWWRLEVTDDGVGMDARTRARIFDPFFTTKGDRHGLGLSAVHGIVRRLGGEISVDSKQGLGTTFHVRVPVIAGAQPKVTLVPPRSTAATSLRGLSILVADDEPSVRSTIRRLLERRGATVTLAGDGEEAAARLRDGSYTLILLDVMMPKLTGYQLLPIARKAQPAARVLLMSGYSDAARGIGGEDEADAFLEKPFTAKQMDAAVDALVDR